MSRSLLETFRSSGDANIGSTLLRLARLAEATHNARAAQPSSNKVEGIDPQAAKPSANTDVRGAASLNPATAEVTR